jgi:salicylate hydroxylase
MKDLRVAIIGAGLGGIVAAIAMRRAGFRATVYEQARAFGDVGAGIQLGPNAMKVLRALELEDGVTRFGAMPEHHVGRSWRSGRVLFKSATRKACLERFGAPFYQVQRADLHAYLRGALPADAIQLDKRCVGIHATRNAVLLRFEDQSEAECDVLVGADGIHSTVRGMLSDRKRRASPRSSAGAARWTRPACPLVSSRRTPSTGWVLVAASCITTCGQAGS